MNNPGTSPSSASAIPEELSRLQTQLAQREHEIAELRRDLAAKEIHVAQLRTQAGLVPEDLKPDIGQNTIVVSGVEIAWNIKAGRCTFRDLPVALMWVDTTLAGLMAGVEAMVGAERFALALQSEGRKSVESDWMLISRYANFREGFAALNNNAAIAGWGDWQLISINEDRQECLFRVYNNWEGLYQKALGVCWGSGMLAGKFAGICSKLFQTNCWATQTKFVARGDPYDEFLVAPSQRSLEAEIEALLVSDQATRADMAVALQKLQQTEASLRQQINERKRVHDELNNARIAALNLMEDAVVAQRQLEKTNAELQEEIAERKRTEQALHEQEKYSRSLLSLSRKLEQAQTYTEVLKAAQAEVRDIVGYQNVWAYLLSEDKRYFKSLVAEGALAETIMSEEGTATLTIAGDPMLEEIASAKSIVVVADARTDERTNKDIVAQVGNRTIVNVPIILFDRHLGAVGMGTFGEEGVLVPTLSQEDYLKSLASHMAVTLDRIHLSFKRQHVEQELAAREQQYRLLVENIPDLIVRYNTDLRRVYVNPAWEKASGLSAAEVVNVPSADIPHVPHPIHEAYQEKLRQVFASGSGQTIEFTWANARGTTLFLEYVIVPEYDPHGQISGVLSVGRDITERRQAEAALRQNEAMLKEAQRLGRLGSWDWDATTDTITWSEEYYRIYELDPRQRPPGYVEHLKAYTPESAARLDAAVQRNLQTGEPYEVDLELARTEGPRRWITARSETKRDADGKIIGLRGTAQDITERKRAEDELRASEEKFRALIEQSAEGVALIDETGCIVEWNRANERITGLSRAEAIGLTLWDMAMITALPERQTELFRDRFKTMVLEALRTGQSPLFAHPIEAQFRPRTSDEAHYLHQTIFPIQTATRFRIASLTHDITERKRAEEALRESERRLVEAQRIAHIGYWERDLDAHRITLSDEACRIFGLAPQAYPMHLEQWHQHWLELIHPEDRARTAQAAVEALQNIRPYNLDYRVTRPTGEVRHIHSEASVRWDDAGRPHSMLGMMQDITDRKHIEEALRRLNRELKAISNCNQVLMRAEQEGALLTDVCRIVCEEAGYRMAWAGFAEQDEAKTVRPVAWAGTEDGYLAAANITWADAERGRGPSGLAIRTGQSACIQDFMTDPQAAPWRASALQRGYRSSIALPLKDEKAHPFGALCIYSTEPAAFVPDEIRLLEELAGDLSFGIVTLRTRAERQRAEAEIQVLARFPEENPNPVLRATREGVLLYSNPASADLMQAWKCSVGQQLPDVWCALVQETLQQGSLREIETACGTRFFVLTLAPIAESGYVNLYGTDITERKRAEEKIRRHVDELERWYDVTLNREERIRELKHEVNQLLRQLGQPARYAAQN